MSQAPVNVSPLIKLARWSMLIAGIGYGAMRQRNLSEIEAENRKEEAKQKAVREARLMEEKKRVHDDEVKALNLLSRPGRGEEH
ncbi:ATP synthase subunit e, mitochondrial [Musca domestica]|uniref:ATP synthase F(0) complex subunit e, mitochondrial n=1 Tax=Musca domestica TaxID=7370 RepID=A0A1I8MIF3_MUSDO|nr:ATP synthase subunit e, mitochondrial [Musca domestica]